MLQQLGRSVEMVEMMLVMFEEDKLMEKELDDEEEKVEEEGNEEDEGNASLDCLGEVGKTYWTYNYSSNSFSKFLGLRYSVFSQ